MIIARQRQHKVSLITKQKQISKPGLIKSQDILDTSWPHGDRHYDLAASIEECLNNYTDATRKIPGLDKYKDISAKDNERMWRASEVIDFDLSIAGHVDGCNYEKQIL